MKQVTRVRTRWYVETFGAGHGIWVLSGWDGGCGVLMDCLCWLIVCSSDGVMVGMCVDVCDDYDGCVMVV